MKRITCKLVGVGAIAVICSMQAYGQGRVGLYEEFTGENCDPCATTNPPFWALCDANSDKLIHISYMVNIPSSSIHYLYQETKSLSDARLAYYNVPSAPNGRFDGMVPDATCGAPAGVNAGNPSCFMQADIDNEATATSPMAITSVHDYNAAGDSIYIKVSLKATTAIAATQLRLRTAFTRTMNFATPPGTNGEQNFEHLVRAMYPDVTGLEVPPMAGGEERVYTLAGAIKGMEALTSYTQADSALYVWVQNDSVGATAKIRDYQSIIQAATSVYRHGFLSVGNINNNEPLPALYPNPARGVVTLSIPGMRQSGPVTIIVTNVYGQMLKNINKNVDVSLRNTQIPIDELRAGVYFITVKTGMTVTQQKLQVVE